jgi:hypothetical protein
VTVTSVVELNVDGDEEIEAVHCITAPANPAKLITANARTKNVKTFNLIFFCLSMKRIL